MVYPQYIPQQVQDQIKKHLDSAITKAIEGYVSAYEDEDVLTGQLFGLMKQKMQSVYVDQGELRGAWKWEIDYKKFRGRGKGASEGIIGADGILEFHLYKGNRQSSKSLLFQSKVDWRNKDGKLYEQCSKLLTWLGAAIVINYTEEGFETYTITDVFSEHGGKPKNKKSLLESIGNDFLICHIGDSDLQYDAVKQQLIWLNQQGEFVSTKFIVNRKLKISVHAPKYQHKIEVQKEIGNADIFKNRLKNGTIEDNIKKANDLSALKKMQNETSKAFHPDKHQSLAEPQIDLLNELMKWNNVRFDEQRDKIKARQNKQKE